MGNKLGKAVVSQKQTWVQTERATHVAWGRLALTNPSAAAVMHQLVAVMDKQNAVAVSHKTLAALVGVSVTTVKRALGFLEESRWLQTVRIGPTGSVNAYVINERVAWADYRDNKRFAVFSARIVADVDDQTRLCLDPSDLRRVPVIHPPEEALPVGDWPPGAQAQLPGFEAVVTGSPIDDDDLDLKEVSSK